MHIVTQSIWVPASGVNGVVPAVGGGVVVLPAIDAQNVSLLVTNNSSGAGAFMLQTDQFNRVPSGNGLTPILPGQSLIFAPSGPADFSNALSESALYASVELPAGGTLTFTRGTVTNQTIIQ